MKKVLSFALVLAMILGSVSMAFAGGINYTDISELDDLHQEAINVLTGLKVIEGYGDGTFKPAGAVTRAEMVKMIIAALNLPVTEGTYTTQFEDVAPDAWYSAYVYYATTLGIIEGKTPTKFDPKGNVTYDQAITMVMRALGYTEAGLNGEYPSCFVNKAVGLNALNGLVSGSEDANRADCALLIYNVLQCELGKVGTDEKWEAYGDGDNMLKRLGATVAQEKNAEGKLVDKEVIVGDDLDLDDENLLVNLSGMLGHKITYYENEDEEIVAVAKVLTTELSGKYVVKDKKIAGVKMTDNADPTSPAATFVNGMASEFEPKADTSYTWTVIMKNGKVDEVVSVIDWVVTQAAVMTEDDVEEIADEDVPAVLGVDLPLDEDDVVLENKVVLNGVDKLADIKKGNVVYVYENDDNEVARVDVGTKVVEGTVDKVNASSGKPTVDGTTYSLAYDKALTEYAVDFVNNADYPVANTKFMTTWATAGETGNLYLDFAGKVFYADFEAATTSAYAIVLKYQPADDSKTIDGSVAKIELFTAEGEDLIVEVADKMKVGYELNDDVVAQVVRDNKGVGALVKYALNDDGELYSVEVCVPEVKDGIKLDKSGNVDETTVVKKDTVVFVASSGAADKLPKASNWSIAEGKSLFGTEPDALSVYTNPEDAEDVVAIAQTAPAKDEHLLIFADADEIKVGSNKKFEYTVLENGELNVKYRSGNNPTVDQNLFKKALVKADAVLYTVEIKTNGEIDDASFAAWEPVPEKGTTIASIGTLFTTTATKYVNDNVLKVDDDNYFTIDENIVVYIWNKDTKKWTVGGFNDLKGIKVDKNGECNVVRLDLIDTVEEKKDPEYLYNVAIMVVEE